MALPDSGTFNAAFFKGMKGLPKKLLPLTLIGIAVTSLYSIQPAQAYTVTLEQVGANVVANGSGPINLTGLTFLFEGAQKADVTANQPAIITGRTSFIPADIYTGFTGPASFGSGGLFLPNTGSGNTVGVSFFDIFGFILSVPAGYVSNAALSDSMTFDHKTINILGLTPGTYVWTWGAGLPNQNFTLQIVAPTTVPDGGSTVSLLGCALLGLAVLRRKLSC